MDVSAIIQQYSQKLLQRYGNRMLPSHRKALDAMLACRKLCGEVQTQCGDCRQLQVFPLSCGHRSCPKCQNSDTTAWIERQCGKLLPVPYFMVTFTIPRELRHLAWSHQSMFYTLLFNTASETLKTLGLDTKHLGANLGFTGVLHTHTRRLDYHPHIHFIVPGGGISQKGKKSCFKRVSSNYLIKGDVIAKLFRGKLIYALLDNGLDLPGKLPPNWLLMLSQSEEENLRLNIYPATFTEASSVKTILLPTLTGESLFYIPTARLIKWRPEHWTVRILFGSF